MMTPAQIRSSSQVRKDFLDFFKSKHHTIVPSSSLMPDSPNLLFTNAGMNQFVPIFLGQTKCPYTPGRAADTQKCIRAGGKHNDLEDVGLDTYHHTFFEMLGNWSFGDYFKREAIEWAWELVAEKWKFPAARLYATVYSPDKSKKDPSEFDQEAWNCWAEKFRIVGLDPKIHIVSGGKKDNFWMMGETGPCGPCSELHVDLTPNGDTNGKLVNAGSPQCIEIWNLVFIQFNANPGGTFSPLPARHVDTGMGFERVTSIIQGTKGLTDFANAKISNYETDIFRPIFDALEKLSGKKYGSTLPVGQASRLSQTSEKNSVEKDGNRRDACPTPEQIALDIAFRVIADHIRTLGFAIADGIQPGNNDRNYVLRRILRRAVRYGRTLGFHEPFFYKLVDVLADTMGDVFPEIRARKKQVLETIRTEEEAFNRTLDKGLTLFESVLNTRQFLSSNIVEFSEIIDRLEARLNSLPDSYSGVNRRLKEMEADSERLRNLSDRFAPDSPVLPASSVETFSVWLSALISSVPSEDNYQKVLQIYPKLLNGAKQAIADVKLWKKDQFGGWEAFVLYDTYGFPLDLTELMARERGLTVDKESFEKLMDEQRARARAAQKKEVISLSQIETTAPTKFVGYENLAVQAKVLEVVSLKDKTAVVLDTSPFYAEMGGQVGDTGELTGSGQFWRVINTQKSGNTWLHLLESERRLQAAALPDKSGVPQTEDLPLVGSTIVLTVDKPRRDAIQRHHTVTHLLHWALHEVASREASQKGSFVGPDKLTFDFNSAPLTPQQVADIEKLVNERILENAGVSWTEVPYADAKLHKDVMQFFGDKYGDTVRVVQIGGHAAKLDGYSMELCGGTHTRATGEIGLFRIVGESAIAAGVRRIEAVAGLEAYRKASDEVHLIKTLAGKVNSPVHELDKKIEALLAHQKELEKSLRTATMREASNAASLLLEEVKIINGIPVIIHNLGAAGGDFLQAIADSLKGRFKGVIILGGVADGAVALLAAVSPDFVKNVQAGKIIQQIAPIVGGKGGGKPDNARGGGKDAGKLDEALAKAKALLG
jgi:alanyl-tRNA synthetase